MTQPSYIEVNELRLVHLKTAISKEEKSCLVSNVTTYKKKEKKVKLHSQLEKDIIPEKSCVFSN